MIDIVGNEIEVGDTFILGNRNSTTAYLDIGRITKIEKGRIYFRKYNRSPWRTRDEAIDSYTKATERIYVISKELPNKLSYILDGNAT